MTSPSTTYDHQFPLHAACRSGDLSGVLARVTGGDTLDVNARDSRGRTPLWLAAERGHAEIVELLLDLGADANVADADKQDTPLSACVRSRVPSSSLNSYSRASDTGLRIARALLDAGAKTNVYTVDVETPLGLAARAGDVELAELLLAQGADVDGARWDQSPLVGACAFGHVRMVRLLLDEGGEVCSMNGKSLEDLLFIAAVNGDEEMIKLLLRRGSPVCPEYDGADRNALHAAVAGGHAEITRLLLEAGADPEETNNNWQCALHVAAESGQVGTVSALIEHGADVNRTDYSNTTALHVAVLQGHADVVACLLDGGARDCRDDQGGTALLIATSSSQVEVVQLLLSRGWDNGIVQNERECVERAVF